MLLIGAASSVYSLARQSYLTEMVPPHMRARALSTLGGTMRIGVFVGPFLGAGAMQLWGLPGAYYVSLAAIVAAGVIVYRVPDLEVSDERKAAAAEVTTWACSSSTGDLRHPGRRRPAAVGDPPDPAGRHPALGSHIGLSPTASSVIYGVAGAVDALTFYPAGKVMDVYGRRWVAVPCVMIMGISFLLMPLTHGAVTLACSAMIMGFGNGIGSGIVMTLAADISPAIGRPTFLGSGGSWPTPVGRRPRHPLRRDRHRRTGLGIIVSGSVGFAAAVALWNGPRNHPAVAITGSYLDAENVVQPGLTMLPLRAVSLGLAAPSRPTIE